MKDKSTASTVVEWILSIQDELCVAYLQQLRYPLNFSRDVMRPVPGLRPSDGGPPCQVVGQVPERVRSKMFKTSITTVMTLFPVAEGLRQ